MTEPRKAVFLSYASQDAAAARDICEALQAGGIEVWFDQGELRGGDLWDRQIRQQIHDCALFIPIISKNSQARPEGYFRLEWRLAVERMQLMSERVAFLVPVAIDDLHERDADVPNPFRAAQWTRLLPGGQTPASFVQRISRLLAPTAASEPQTPTSSTRPTTKARSPLRALWLTVVVAVFAATYLAFDKFVLLQHAAETVAPPPVPAIISHAADSPPKSIAVLPFLNMSADKEQEYFSDGLAEELLDLLAKTPGLHVIARTSSFYFKGKQVPLAEIAKTLGVANILEGSVRKAGTHLRVSTQLIAANSGEELWSETYDRELKDVFKVQDEIAGAVVAALRLKLAPAHTLADRGTASTAAYEQFLLGRQDYDSITPEGYRRAVQAYKQAIALDPNYAAAYAGLAFAQSYLTDYTGEGAGDNAPLRAADKAVMLAPDQAFSYGARGTIRMNNNFDWAGADADLSKALELDPTDSIVLRRYGSLQAELGRLPEAIAATNKAIETDPLSSGAWSNLTLYYMATGDFAAARNSINHAIAINPQSMYAVNNLGVLELLDGSAAEALATFRTSSSEFFRLLGIALAEHSLGHARESQRALDELITKNSNQASYQIAEIYAWRGQKDEAFLWLDRAYERRDGGLGLVTYDSLTKSLRKDPRFHSLLRKLKLPD